LNPDDPTSAIEQDLRTSTDSGTKGSIGLPGAEVVLTFIAIQILVPVISSFISDVLFDKFKKITTRSEAAQAREVLNGHTLQPQPVVPAEKVTEEVKASLIAEGLSDQAAEKAIKSALERVGKAAAAAGAK
jgi:hypothetical protein